MIGAASMAGFPPLLACVAKEAVLTTFWVTCPNSPGRRPWSYAVVGSVLTVAYSARFLWGRLRPQVRVLLGSRRRPRRPVGRRRAHARVVGLPHVAPWSSAGSCTVVLGLFPRPWRRGSKPTRSCSRADGPRAPRTVARADPRRWASPRSSSWPGCCCTGAQAGVRLQAAAPSLPSGDYVYRWIINVLDIVAVWLTGRTSMSRFMFYLSVILVTAVVVPLSWPCSGSRPTPCGLPHDELPAQLATGIAMVVAALLVLTAGKRSLRCCVSVTGYGLALLLALHGARTSRSPRCSWRRSAWWPSCWRCARCRPLWNRRKAGHRCLHGGLRGGLRPLHDGARRLSRCPPHRGAGAPGHAIHRIRAGATARTW
ncbi:hypothetical protein QJS66_17900 [Kocuria rhizophila]|nr:hypothetical protein QJS66_17900 [Kocuria rhizophila]